MKKASEEGYRQYTDALLSSESWNTFYASGGTFYFIVSYTAMLIPGISRPHYFCMPWHFLGRLLDVYAVPTSGWRRLNIWLIVPNIDSPNRQRYNYTYADTTSLSYYCSLCDHQQPDADTKEVRFRHIWVFQIMKLWTRSTTLQSNHQINLSTTFIQSTNAQKYNYLLISFGGARGGTQYWDIFNH